MTNFGKLFADEITNWMTEKSSFKHPQCKMYIHYKYTPYWSKLDVLSYVDDCVYYYTHKELLKWFLDTVGNISHVKFLGYAHWFKSISIPQLKDHSISVDQAGYAIYVVAKYLDTAKIK